MGFPLRGGGGKESQRSQKAAKKNSCLKGECRLPREKEGGKIYRGGVNKRHPPVLPQLGGKKSNEKKKDPPWRGERGKSLHFDREGEGTYRFCEGESRVFGKRLKI